MKWRRVGLFAGWGVVIGALIAQSLDEVRSSSFQAFDFAIFFTAANALRHNPHAAIYALPTLAATHATYGGCAPPTGWGYLYQPLLALVLEPLTLLPCGAAIIIYQGFNVAVALACVLWLTRHIGRRHGAGAALATAALLAINIPAFFGLLYGNVEALMLGVCLASVSLMRHGHPRWAGALLALGAFLKYLPALLLVYYLARRRWGTALGAAIAGATLALFELVMVGPDTLVASVTRGSGNLLATIGVSMTASLPGEPYAVAFLALALYTVITLAIARFGSADDPSELGLSAGEAWAIGAMAFVSPLMWYAYFLWLTPALIVVLDAALATRPGQARWLSLTALVSLYALTLLYWVRPVAVAANLAIWLICGGLALSAAGALLWRMRPRMEQVAQLRQISSNR